MLPIIKKNCVQITSEKIHINFNEIKHIKITLIFGSRFPLIKLIFGLYFNEILLDRPRCYQLQSNKKG